MKSIKSYRVLIICQPRCLSLRGPLGKDPGGLGTLSRQLHRGISLREKVLHNDRAIFTCVAFSRISDREVNLYSPVVTTISIKLVNPGSVSLYLVYSLLYVRAQIIFSYTRSAKSKTCLNFKRHNLEESVETYQTKQP